MPEFQLSQQLIGGHTGEVRCACVLRNAPVGTGSQTPVRVITGGLDAACLVWEFVGSQWIHSRSIHGHSGFVYAVVPHPGDPGSCFISTGNDRRIFAWDSVTGEKIMDFSDSVNVHSLPISSLTVVDQLDSSGVPTALLVAGSWDGSFSVWDIATGVLLFKQENAGKHAVSVAWMAGPYNMLVTGSQDKALRFWTIEYQNAVSQVVFNVPEAHGDIIRSIRVDERSIYTASNDGTVRVWKMALSESAKLEQALSGHSNFVFAVDAFVALNRTLIASASEDKQVIVWELGDEGFRILENLSHPGTVWFSIFVSLDDHVDLLTGCSDGTLRVFTNDVRRVASAAETATYDELCRSIQAKQNNQAVDPATVAPESDMPRYRGKKPGEVKMFKDEKNVVYAYQWNAALGGWDKVGLVTGGSDRGSKKNYTGDQYFPSGPYDYVFDVELDAATGRMAKLPVNDGDNALVVAEKFCAKENINKANISQIMDFLKINMNPHSVVTKTVAAAVSSETPRFSAPLVPFLFKEAKLPQLKSKLMELVASLETEEKLTLNELSMLEQTLNNLQQIGNVSVSSSLPPGALPLVFSKLPFAKFSQSNDLFVLFDLWRLLALDTAVSASLFKDADRGSKYILTASRLLSKSSSNNLGVCTARYLANLFSNSVSKWAVYDHWKSILSVCANIISSPSATRPLLLAASSVMANLAIAAGDKQDGSVKTAIAVQLSDLNTSMHDEPEVIYRLCIALGCCVVGNDSAKQSAGVAIKNLKGSNYSSYPSHVKECIENVESLL